MRASAIRSHLERLLALLLPLLDVIHASVEEAKPPAWCEARGWTRFLLALDDATLADAEAQGLNAKLLEHPQLPPDLRQVLLDARACVGLTRSTSPPLSLPEASLRGVSARKREQLRHLLAAVAPQAARAERIVDVGAGHGHFSRLAAELFDKPSVALDRDALLLQTGTLRSQQRARSVGALDHRFVLTDLSEQALELAATDLAVGLHACGELGDRLVLAAGEVRCDLALVSCCLQKVRASIRTPLSRAANSLLLHKPALGLTNLSARSEGVEATLEQNLQARELRLALRQLLQERGLDVAPGQEMRGLNRRRAQSNLPELASHALAARGLPPPTIDELQQHGDNARRDHATIRRLSLPRTLLARPVELAIVLDRGAALEERGLAVQLLQWCEQQVTPRNTLLLASAS